MLHARLAEASSSQAANLHRLRFGICVGSARRAILFQCLPAKGLPEQSGMNREILQDQPEEQRKKRPTNSPKTSKAGDAKFRFPKFNFHQNHTRARLFIGSGCAVGALLRCGVLVRLCRALRPSLALSVPPAVGLNVGMNANPPGFPIIYQCCGKDMGSVTVNGGGARHARSSWYSRQITRSCPAYPYPTPSKLFSESISLINRGDDFRLLPNPMNADEI
jgi:hypothetical protein